MKKGFIIVTFVLGVALVAMLLTKPEPKEHLETFMLCMKELRTKVIGAI